MSELFLKSNSNIKFCANLCNQYDYERGCTHSLCLSTLSAVARGIDKITHCTIVFG